MTELTPKINLPTTEELAGKPIKKDWKKWSEKNVEGDKRDSIAFKIFMIIGTLMIVVGVYFVVKYFITWTN